MQHLDDDLHLPKQNVETQSLCTLPLNASWLLIRRLCEFMIIGPTSQVNSTSCVPMSIRTTWNRICYRWRSGPRWRFVMRKGRRNCRQSFAKMGTPHWLCKERNIARSPAQHQGLCGWNRWTFPNIALPENAYAIGRKRLDISPRRGVALQRLSTVLIGGSVSAGIGWIFGRNKRLGSSAKLFFGGSDFDRLCWFFRCHIGDIERIQTIQSCAYLLLQSANWLPAIDEWIAGSKCMHLKS